MTVISKLPPTFGVAFLPILLTVSSSYDCLQANNLPVNIMPSIYPGQSHAHSMYSADDLPKTVMANLNQGSAVKSMDFHPLQQTLLLGLITFPTLSRHLLVRISVRSYFLLSLFLVLSSIETVTTTFLVASSILWNSFH